MSLAPNHCGGPGIGAPLGVVGAMPGAVLRLGAEEEVAEAPPGREPLGMLVPVLALGR